MHGLHLFGFILCLLIIWSYDICHSHTHKTGWPTGRVCIFVCVCVMILRHLWHSHMFIRVTLIRPGGPPAVFVFVCNCVCLCLCLWLYDICQTVTHIRPGGPLAVFGRVAVMQIYSAHLEHSIQKSTAWRQSTVELTYKSTVEMHNKSTVKMPCKSTAWRNRRLLSRDTLSTSCFYPSTSSYLPFSIPINTCSHANLL